MTDVLKELLIVFLLCNLTQGISHTRTLIWSERFLLDGTVKIKGLVGDPTDWGSKQTEAGQAVPAQGKEAIPHMVALGFRYNHQELYYSDRGYKTLYKFKLANKDGREDSKYRYNTSSASIYTGTSSEVNGIAVDWLSGTIYWTDARYNWVAAAATKSYEIYKYLFTTGLDMPMGIAVYPQKGLLFWSDWGVVPKIESARLDGSNRRTLLVKDLDYPMGMSIDYQQDHLYWVDDARDSIERSDLDGGNRVSIDIRVSPTSRHFLFGISVFQDYIFITDQKRWSIGVFNKRSRRKLQEIQVGLLAMPYDVMMYDSSIQDPEPSECTSLDCEHLCFSLGDGKARCECSTGFTLEPDQRSCNVSTSFIKPQFIYSIGHSLCGSKIHFADRFYSPGGEIDCFLDNLDHVEAIAFDSYAELLFYSDTNQKSIHRKRLTGDYDEEVIAEKTGNVRGLAVDWLSDNLYWTDEDKGHVMVSNLEGRYPTVVISGLNRPRGLALDPAKGLMYFSCQDAIYRADMDGSNVRVFLSDNVTRPDGLVLDLLKNKFYWTDSQVPGIGVVNLDGTKRSSLVIDLYPNTTFRDVTVYQDYLAATDGKSNIYYAYVEDGYMVRGTKHEESYVSHDIITYGPYLQPLPESGSANIGRCDRQCDHLCLPIRNGYTCECSLGFYLEPNNKTCLSDLVDVDFLLLVDPYQKQAYQLPLGDRQPRLQAVGLETAEQPLFVDYDFSAGQMYWFDNKGGVIKRKSWKGLAEEVVVILEPGTSVGAIAVDDINHILFYTDASRGKIVQVTLPEIGSPVQFDFISSHVVAAAMTVDKKRGFIFWAEEKDGEKAIYSQRTTATHPSIMLHKYGDHFSEDLTRLTLDVEGNWLYSCTSRGEVSGIDLQGFVPNRVIQLEPGSDSKLAVYENFLFYTHEGIVMMKDMSEETYPIAMTPENVFTEITDLKVVVDHTPVSSPTSASPTPSSIASPASSKPVSAVSTMSSVKTTTKESESTSLNPTPNRQGKVGEEKDKMNTNSIFILVGAVSASVVVLAVVIAIVVVLLRKNRKKTMPPVPPADFDIQAHDNPTYMTTKDLQSVRRNITLPPGGATGVSHDPLPEKADVLPEELPGDENPHEFSPEEKDKVQAPSSLAPASQTSPQSPPLTSSAPALPPIRETGGAVSEIPEADTEKLVDNEQVIVSLDSISSQAVSYSPSNTQEKKK